MNPSTIENAATAQPRPLTSADLGRRVRRARLLGSTWHRIESIIDGAAITRCGRRMESEDGRGRMLWVGDGMPSILRACLNCSDTRT